MTNQTAVVVREGETMPVDATALIQRAIDANLPVETMERLLAMRRELRAEAARDGFFRSLSEFQAGCLTIKKETKVNYPSKRGGQVRYSYATLDEIVSQVRANLEIHGFSYTVSTEQDQDSVTAVCHAHHVEGHSEITKFRIPVDPEAYMNAAQKVASALTYAKRYAFCNAFGILTGDADDDARLTGNGDEPHLKDAPDTVSDLDRRPYPPADNKAASDLQAGFDEKTDTDAKAKKLIGEIMACLKVFGKDSQKHFFAATGVATMKGASVVQLEGYLKLLEAHTKKAKTIPPTDGDGEPEDVELRFGKHSGCRMSQLASNEVKDGRQYLGWIVNKMKLGDRPEYHEANRKLKAVAQWYLDNVKDMAGEEAA